jgi:hypothetical protein
MAAALLTAANAQEATLGSGTIRHIVNVSTPTLTTYLKDHNSVK